MSFVADDIVVVSIYVQCFRNGKEKEKEKEREKAPPEIRTGHYGEEANLI